VKYLLDTCVLSELVRTVPDASVLRWTEARKPGELFISTMTLAELLRGVGRLPRSRRRSELAQWLKQLEVGFEDRILPFDEAAAQAWAEMTVHAESRGKTMTAFDAIIAATARAHGCRLVTRNVRDFAHAGIDWLNPWESA
jgi:predicted nucleic acid-binding protein